jgi:hypothetical protein
MIKNLKNRIKRTLVNYLVRNLLQAITEEEILIMAGKEIKLNGRKLSLEEVAQLKEECQEFGKSFLWKMMSHEIRFQAGMRMMEKAEQNGDIVYRKAMLYNLDLLRKFIDNLTK